MEANNKFYAFDAAQLIATGSERDLALGLNSYLKQNEASNILVFNVANGRQTDIDFAAVSAELELDLDSPIASGEADTQNAVKKPRGRPRLGVVGREVTLLPRHWQWLDAQRSGASAALRRLIDAERKNNTAQDQIRESQDSANRFMAAMAGDLKGFEEAVRALYGGDKASFAAETAAWPVDIKRIARQFAEPALV